MGVQDGNATYGNDQTKVAEVLNDGNGTQGTVTIGTSVIEAKVGGSRLTNRKSLTVYNGSNATIYWGYTNGVTTSTGTPIFKDQFYSWAIGDAQPVYLIAGSMGNIARVTEAD